MKKTLLVAILLSSLFCYSQVKLISLDAGGYDVDASKYFTAENITLASDKQAISNLCIRLKQHGLFNTKVKCLYPFRGSYYTHNLIDTSLYKGTFMGTGTTSATGYIPNGSTGYMKTGFIASSVLTSGSHISVYVGTDNANGGGGIDVGAASSGPGTNMYLSARYSTSNNVPYANNGNGTAILGVLKANSKGFTLTNKVGSACTMYVNGVQSGATVTDAGGYASREFYVGAFNNVGTAGYFISREYRTVTVGNSLTAQEAIYLEDDIFRYNQELGRVYEKFNWFIGDSYTYGAYSGRTDNNTWCYKLDSILLNKQVCINNGVSGMAITQHRVTGASYDKTTLPIFGPRDNILAFSFSTDNDLNQALTVSPATNTINHMDSDLVTILNYGHNTSGWPYSRMVGEMDWYVPPVDSAVHNPWHRGAMGACTGLGMVTISHQIFMTNNGGNTNVITAGSNDHPSYLAQLRSAVNTFNFWFW